MSAVYVSNLVINSGATFQQQFELESSSSNSATNLAGFHVAAQMRKHAGSTSVAATFTSSIVDADAGTIRVGLSSVTTAGLKSGRYVYDVELILADSTIEKVHYGIVTVNPEATKV